jgi:hypothetical protein
MQAGLVAYSCISSPILVKELTDKIYYISPCADIQGYEPLVTI